MEWIDNAAISGQAPSDYVPNIEKKFSSEELKQMYFWHALPEEWYSMDYGTFLQERRKRMAEVTRRGFETLQKATAYPDSVERH